MPAMSFNEFIELVTKEQPALEDISEIMAFAEKADAEVIWEALQTSGIHTIIVALLTNVLQQKIQHARAALGMLGEDGKKARQSITAHPRSGSST